jgi:hypothetical protein
MALANVSDVLEESGATYSMFLFDDDTSFRYWVGKKLTWVDGKIKNLVGVAQYNLAPDDLKYCEVFWTLSTMLRRRQMSLGSSLEGGFAIGSLRIDTGTKATEGTSTTSQDLFKRAMVLLQPYAPQVVGNYLIVEDDDDE